MLVHLRDALAMHRLVTIVGAGGMGKTALALAAIADSANDAGVECVFVDFSTSVSLLHVEGRIFEELGLEGNPRDITAHLVRALLSRNVLLVFDNCEHVIGHVAGVAGALTSGTEGVSILATSREPMRIPGERVLPLEPLNCPPEGASLTSEEAMRYTAIEMFVQAANMRSRAFAIDNKNASLLGEVCRRLDGIPLAIELAAATTDIMTVNELVQRLDDRFAVLTRGTRTALPRHRTLQAALDWSYDALSEGEATVMRRLGVFPGQFSTTDAQAVAANGALSGLMVQDALADLVAKSLLTVDVSGEVASFRFLETMRVYARLKLLESDEASTLYARFVERTLVELLGMNGRDGSAEDIKRGHNDLLDDWRAAHDWATRAGDWHTALRLMEAGTGFCQRLNITVEYVDRAKITLRSVPSDLSDEEILRSEMAVCNQTAQILIDLEQSSRSLEWAEMVALRSLALSRKLQAPEHQMSSLVTLTLTALTLADAAKLTAYASQVDALAQRSQDPDFLRIAHYLNGYAKYYSSDLGAALYDLDQALVGASTSKPNISATVDYTPSVRTIRSRALWTRGEFQSSLDEMAEAHRAAIEGGYAPTIAWVAWGGGVCVYLWAGAIEQAAASALIFENLAREHSNPGWAAYIPALHEAFDRLRHPRRSFDAGPTSWTPTALSHVDIMTSIHCAFHRPADLQRMEGTPHHWCAAEHFRAAGEQRLAAGQMAEAERYFLRALATSTAQGAVAWEIRATLSLARLRIQQDQRVAVRELLEPISDRFADWSVNADLVHARELLDAH
ncbi:transcriptional regulator [Sphingomonas sp. DBB INV C78]